MPKQRRCISQDRFGPRYLHLFSFNFFLYMFAHLNVKWIRWADRNLFSLYCVSPSSRCKTNFFLLFLPIFDKFCLNDLNKSNFPFNSLILVRPFKSFLVFFAQSSRYNCSSCKHTRNGQQGWAYIAHTLIIRIIVIWVQNNFKPFFVHYELAYTQERKKKRERERKRKVGDGRRRKTITIRQILMYKSKQY